MAWNDKPPEKHELAVLDDWTSKPPSENEMRDAISPVVSGVRKGVQGASAGFLDEASGLVEAAGRAAGVKGLGGSFDDVEQDERGPTFSLAELKEAYKLGRDRKREYLKKDSEDNPGVSAAAELAGAIVSPVNKIAPNASLVKSGAIIGGVSGLGNSEADNIKDALLDTGSGIVTGAVLGKATQKAAPYIQKGASAVGRTVDKAKQKAGKVLNEAAENLAYKATGATLRDLRAANKNGNVNRVGRYLLDKGIVGAFDDVDDVARKALSDNEAAGQALDDIYTKAETQFKDKLQKVGFDPLRDKAEIMKAAEKELGDTVGKEAALNKLSKYLDEVAESHGDKPMQAAMAKYEDEVAEYIPKRRQYLKDKKQYQNEIGKAADDLDQQILPGTYDDLQRTGNKKTTVELNGKPPSKIEVEPYEPWTQQELVPLTVKPQGQFNPARGDDLLSMKHQMELDDIFRNEIGKGYQAEMLNTKNVPRTYGEGQVPSITQGSGQLKFSMAPNAPIRPVKPADIRNPMSPRRSNDIKGAFDNEINYSRNPLTKEPATEKAFYGARSKLAEKVEQGLDDLGGGEVVEALKKANREYGYSKQASQMAKDRELREQANKWFGLTDTIAAGASATYGAVTGDWQTALVGMAGKKAVEKYGVATLAAASNKIAKRLLKSPQIAKIAAEKPAVFGAMVYDLVQRIETKSSSVLPKAADQKPLKGEDKWANDGGKKLIDSGLSPEIIEQLKQDKKGKRLLIEASDLTPGSKAMDSVIKRIRTGSSNKGEN